MAQTYRNYLQQQYDAGQSAAGPLLNMVGDDGVFGTDRWADSSGRVHSRSGEAGNANAFFLERFRNSGPGAASNDSAANPAQYQTVGNSYDQQTAAEERQKQNNIEQLNNQIGMLRSLFGGADAAFAEGNANIDNAYARSLALGDQQHTRAIEDYNLQGDRAERDRSTGLQETESRARSLADALRQKIGLASGRNSSAYQINAPGAVADATAADRTGVLEAYGDNYLNLARAKEDTEEDYGMFKRGLSDERANKRRALHKGYEENKQSLNREIAGLEGKRGSLNGTQDMAALLSPYLNAFNNSQNVINSLKDKYRTPTYETKGINPEKINLDKYSADPSKMTQSEIEKQARGEFSTKKKEEDEDSIF